jgi:hypothetical protein
VRVFPAVQVAASSQLAAATARAMEHDLQPRDLGAIVSAAVTAATTHDASNAPTNSVLAGAAAAGLGMRVDPPATADAFAAGGSLGVAYGAPGGGLKRRREQLVELLQRQRQGTMPAAGTAAALQQARPLGSMVREECAIAGQSLYCLPTAEACAAHTPAPLEHC